MPIADLPLINESDLTPIGAFLLPNDQVGDPTHSGMLPSLQLCTGAMGLIDGDTLWFSGINQEQSALHAVTIPNLAQLQGGLNPDHTTWFRAFRRYPGRRVDMWTSGPARAKDIPPWDYSLDEYLDQNGVWQYRTSDWFEAALFNSNVPTNATAHLPALPSQLGYSIIRGILQLPSGEVVISMCEFYGDTQRRSHFVMSSSNLTDAFCTPLRLAKLPNTFERVSGVSQTQHAGFTGGAMSNIPEAWQAEFGGNPHWIGNYNVSVTSRCFNGPSMLPCDLAGLLNNAEITVDVAAAKTQSSEGARWRWPGTPYDGPGGVPFWPYSQGYRSSDNTVAPGGNGLTGPPTPWNQPKPRIHGYLCEDGYCCGIDGTRTIIVPRFSPNENTAVIYGNSIQGITNPDGGLLDHGIWYNYKKLGPPFQPDGGEFPLDGANSPKAVHYTTSGTTLDDTFLAKPGQNVISRRMLFYDAEVIRALYQSYATIGHSDFINSVYEPYRIAPMPQMTTFVVEGPDKLNTPKCVFDPVKRWLYVMQPRVNVVPFNREAVVEVYSVPSLPSYPVREAVSAYHRRHRIQMTSFGSFASGF